MRRRGRILREGRAGTNIDQQAGAGLCAPLAPGRRIAYIGQPGLAAALTIATLEDAGFEVTTFSPTTIHMQAGAERASDACVIQVPVGAGTSPTDVVSLARGAGGVVIVIGADSSTTWVDDAWLRVQRPCSPRFLASFVDLALQGEIAA